MGPGLTNLKGLTQFTTLDLSMTPLNDAGIRYLKGLTHLRELSLGGCQITPKGISDLRGALPGTDLGPAGAPGSGAVGFE